MRLAQGLGKTMQMIASVAQLALVRRVLGVVTVKQLPPATTRSCSFLAWGLGKTLQTIAFIAHLTLVHQLPGDQIDAFQPHPALCFLA